MKGTRYSWLRVTVLATLLFVFMATLAEAATVSGTVTNNSGVAGRVYIALLTEWGEVRQAVSVQPSGTAATPFFIKGVQDNGNLTVVAFVDRTNTGAFHANDPRVSGTPGGVNVSIGDVNVGNLTLFPTGTVSPPKIDPPFLIPFPGGVAFWIDNPTVGDTDTGGFYADAFNISCNGGAYVRNNLKSPSVIDDDGTLGFISGISDGTLVSCVATPVVNGTPVTASASNAATTTVGNSCAAFGTCATGVTVSGRVNLSGFSSLAGKTLVVFLSDWSDNSPPLAVAIPNPVATNNAYSIPGVPPSAYAWRVEAYLVDTASGQIGYGSNGLNDIEHARLMIDGGSNIVAPDVTIKNRTASCTINTQVGFDSWGKYHSLLFECDGELKRPVNITISNATGTGLPDGGISYSPGGSSSYWVDSGFEPGNTYAAEFEFADNSTETLPLEFLKGTVESRIRTSFPSGDVRLPDLTSPIAGWNYSTFAPPMPGTVTSSIEAQGFNWQENLTTATNWFQHLPNPDDPGPPLSIDQNYSIYTSFQDALGDETTTRASFTPRSNGPLISALVPDTGGNGTSVTINGSGFSGATAVAFNGVSASFTVVNGTQINTTVPQGAARGPVTVTAGGITGVSPAPFEKTATITGRLTNSSGGGINLITVSTIGAGVPLSTTTNPSGDFILTVPAGIPLYLKMHDPAGTYRDVYTRFTPYNGSSTGNDYVLFTATDLDGWAAVDSSFTAVKNNTAGMIRARVTDVARNNMAGVTITVRSKNYPKGNPAYKLIYGNTSNQPDPSLDATTSSGRYYITGIEQGDIVYVAASRADYGFIDTLYQVYNGTIGQGRIFGEPVSTATLSPAPGDINFGTPITVTLNPAVNTNFFYTVSLSVWDSNSDPKYYGTGLSSGGTINLTNTGFVTLKYVVRNAAGVFGDEQAVTYNVINDITPPTVYATPPGYPINGSSTFKSAVFPLNVPFTASEPSTIYYTTNGSIPTTSSPALTVSSNWGSTATIPITAGQTLQFFARDAAGNQSPQQSITYSSTTAVSFSGTVLNSDLTPISEATVSMVGHSSLATTTAADGSFTLNNLPSGQDLIVQTSFPGKQNTYSTILNMANNISGRAFLLYTLAEMQAWGNTAGTGVIRGIVQSSGTPLSGAQVWIASSTGWYYPVVYDDGTGMMPGSGTSTPANGAFYVLGVNPGDILTFSASLNGYNFNPSPRFLAQADSVTMGRISGTDTIPPTVYATPPGQPIYNGNGYGFSKSSPISVTFGADEPATIYYTTNGIDPPTLASSSLQVATAGGATTPIIVADGTTVMFFGVDASGNQSTPLQIVTMISDSVAPVISITYYGYNMTNNYNSTSVAYNINATDDSSMFYSQPLWYLVTETSTPPSLSDPGWNQYGSYRNETLSIGTYTRYAWVKDSAGNIGSQMFTFRVDTIPPPRPVVTHFLNDRVNTYYPVVAGTAEANSTMTLFVDGSHYSSTTTNGSGAWTFAEAYIYFSEGSHTVTVTATDAAGNTSVASVPYTFMVDLTSPTSAATPSPAVPVSGYYTLPTTVTVTLSASEGATVYYTLDGTDPNPSACSVNCFSGPAPLAVPITNTVTIKFISVDLAGNPESLVNSVSYTFVNAATVKIDGDTTPYTSIDAALDATLTQGKTVKALNQVFTEAVTMTSPVTIALKGGYPDTGFASQPAGSYTVIKGSLKISKGTLKIDRIKVK